jgi:hypothetical protein
MARLRLVLAPPAPSNDTEPPPIRIPVQAPPKVPVERSRVQLARPEPEELDESSSWDPEPIDEQLEASRCRAFLLEIVRRAVYDWVLYRQHDRLELKAIAADAYTWLFQEGPEHPWSRRRNQEGRGLTSLLAICEVLDLDPDTVRARARTMDIRTILTAGRPPEVRRREVYDETDYQEHGISNNFGVATLGDDPGHSFYENHYSVPTSSAI